MATKKHIKPEATGEACHITQAPPPAPDVIDTLESISARLDSIIGLCWMIGEASSSDGRGFYALGNAIMHEKNELDAAIAGTPREFD